MKATATSKALPAKVGDGKSSGLGYGCMGIMLEVSKLPLGFT